MHSGQAAGGGSASEGLKPIVFDVLLILIGGERHGWSLAKALEEQWGDGRTVLSGNLYRTLRSLRDQGLIEESDARPDPEEDDERRKYFRVTDLGVAAAREHARRLEQRVVASRSAKLLPATGDSA